MMGPRPDPVFCSIRLNLAMFEPGGFAARFFVAGLDIAAFVAYKDNLYKLTMTCFDVHLF